MHEHIIDLNNISQRSTFIELLRQLRGMYRITVVQYRPRRSDRQNRYYWPCFVASFGQFLRDQGESITDLQAHEMLKHKFLRRTFIDTNREPHDYTQSTGDLNTSEFNEYLDNCAAWLADTFGIVVPNADEYREQDSAERGRRVERGAGRSQQTATA